ncbi:protoporphyrinogen oxidase [Mucilaginibacter frigoritolerans]|uniref:Protoporphyrinogen oxidase n=1 Tax=Mucilaginibacter frigoritolerans TaxID=652788 RepID=A0A562UGV8_9SPHI|nr:NAD(P)-binding protein [Mucilaginibacter frigoritolerans]TWJ04617.1 protoporphyrinogen oxidase [Mucilaginibacter frigoritolerans]
MKDITIIGAGISGLSISRMLANKYNVRILEKSEKPGGLIKCDRIEGNLFHKVGGHVFNSRNKDVLNWFWQHFNRDNEFLQAKRNAKIFMDGKLIGYPLENYLYQLSSEKMLPVIEELLELLQKEKKNIQDYENFKDFLIGNFGERLYNLYFGPYNSKIWNTDISKVPLEWLDGKLPMPQIKDILISNILRNEESQMVHAFFYYPKAGGSQFIINKLAEQQEITLSYCLSTISLNKNQKLIINNELASDAVIYTGDIRHLHSIINIDDGELNIALESVKDLLSNGTSNVLCETDDNDISWLYLPEDKFNAHRIIYTGNFSSTNNGEGSRKTCVVEFSGKQDTDVMINELNILPGNLKALAFNYEPNSYIIQQKDTRDKVNHLKSLLKNYNIYLLGRFAEWEYYNMDKCIESAMQLNALLTY